MSLHENPHVKEATQAARKARIASYIAIACAVIAVGLAIADAAHADDGPVPTLPTMNITLDVQIDSDVILAGDYWTAMRPKLVSGCPFGPEVFLDDSLPPDIIGLTPISGCAIYVAPIVLQWATSRSPVQRWAACLLIAHEYAHTLGLPDSVEPRMMNQSGWAQADDPVCQQAAYGWWSIGHFDRMWLVAAGLAHRGERA